MQSSEEIEIDTVGGVMLLIRSDISAVRRQDLETGCELVWIQLFLPSSKPLIGARVYYRPPSSPIEHLHQLRYSLANVPDSCPVILCGDFNVGDIDWETVSPTRTLKEAALLCEIVDDNCLRQLVTTPTRVNRTLDLVFSNQPDLLSAVSMVDGLPCSDHDGVSFVIKLSPPRHSTHKRYIYDFKTADMSDFNNRLAAVPWDVCLSDDDVQRNFSQLLMNAFQSVIKCKIGKVKTWLSHQTLKAIRQKMKCTGKKLEQYRAVSNSSRPDSERPQAACGTDNS